MKSIFIKPIPSNYQWAIVDYYPERVSALGFIDSRRKVNIMIDIRASNKTKKRKLAICNC